MLLTNKTKNTGKNPVILVNQSEQTRKEFIKYADKSLVEVDVMENGKLEDITLGKRGWEGGDDIMNLVLVFKNKKVAFPLSRKFSEEVTNDPTALLDGQFYLRKRMREGEPTGEEYLSFGKPSGIAFDSELSLVTAQEVEQ